MSDNRELHNSSNSRPRLFYTTCNLTILIHKDTFPGSNTLPFVIPESRVPDSCIFRNGHRGTGLKSRSRWSEDRGYCRRNQHWRLYRKRNIANRPGTVQCGGPRALLITTPRKPRGPWKAGKGRYNGIMRISGTGNRLKL